MSNAQFNPLTKDQWSVRLRFPYLNKNSDHPRVMDDINLFSEILREITGAGMSSDEFAGGKLSNIHYNVGCNDLREKRDFRFTQTYGSHLYQNEGGIVLATLGSMNSRGASYHGLEFLGMHNTSDEDVVLSFVNNICGGKRFPRDIFRISALRVG